MGKLFDPEGDCARLNSVTTWSTKKTVIPASEARRESFFKTIWKIPDKPEWQKNGKNGVFMHRH